jgi:hypothetical protein
MPSRHGGTNDDTRGEATFTTPTVKALHFHEQDVRKCRSSAPLLARTIQGPNVRVTSHNELGALLLISLVTFSSLVLHIL